MNDREIQEVTQTNLPEIPQVDIQEFEHSTSHPQDDNRKNETEDE